MVQASRPPSHTAMTGQLAINATYNRTLQISILNNFSGDITRFFELFPHFFRSISGIKIAGIIRKKGKKAETFPRKKRNLKFPLRVDLHTYVCR